MRSFRFFGFGSGGLASASDAALPARSGFRMASAAVA